MREYYDRRAPEYDDWYLGPGLFADRDRPGWRTSSINSPRRSPRYPPQEHSTWRAARDSSRAISAATSSVSTREPGCSPKLRARFRPPPSSRVTRSRCRFPTELRPRVHRALLRSSPGPRPAALSRRGATVSHASWSSSMPREALAGRRGDVAAGPRRWFSLGGLQAVVAGAARPTSSAAASALRRPLVRGRPSLALGLAAGRKLPRGRRERGECVEHRYIRTRKPARPPTTSIRCWWPSGFSSQVRTIPTIRPGA